MDTPNLISHITQRAVGRDPLFLEDDDYLAMLVLLKQIAEKYSLTVYALCLMSNHLHLILRPKEQNLYDSMRDLYSKYARRFNGKYQRKGHLFGGPYRQAVCLDDSYLLAASLYIHINPVRAGILKDPFAYRWSSCQLYSDSGRSKSFVNENFILGIISSDKDTAKKKYNRLLEKGAAVNTGHVLEEETAIDAFRQKLADRFPSLFKKMSKENRVSKSLGANLLSIDELERQIATRQATEWEPPGTKDARRFLIEQLIARGYRRSEIAAKLELNRKTIYNILQKKA